MKQTRFYLTPVLFLALMSFTYTASAQSEQSNAVTDGGISAPGWMGQIDAGEAANGLKLENSKLAMEGDVLHVTTGPSVAYWHPDNMASGNYTVSATFHEAEFMGLNNHPHPYGIFIGGNDMGTDQQSYLYCAAYGNGKTSPGLQNAHHFR